MSTGALVVLGAIGCIAAVIGWFWPVRRGPISETMFVVVALGMWWLGSILAALLMLVLHVLRIWITKRWGQIGDSVSPPEDKAG